LRSSRPVRRSRKSLRSTLSSDLGGRHTRHARRPGLTLIDCPVRFLDGGNADGKPPAIRSRRRSQDGGRSCGYVARSPTSGNDDQGNERTSVVGSRPDLCTSATEPPISCSPP
jgi:hypothetical protein